MPGCSFQQRLCSAVPPATVKRGGPCGSSAHLSAGWTVELPGNPSATSARLLVWTKNPPLQQQPVAGNYGGLRCVPLLKGCYGTRESHCSHGSATLLIDLIKSCCPELYDVVWLVRKYSSVTSRCGLLSYWMVFADWEFYNFLWSRVFLCP